MARKSKGVALLERLFAGRDVRDYDKAAKETWAKDAAGRALARGRARSRRKKAGPRQRRILG